jgi:hypothetical protein
MAKFQYNSIQEHVEHVNGNKRMKVMEVKIRNGRGYKRVTLKNNSGKLLSSDKKILSKKEIQNILQKKFIPGLFTPCINKCNFKLTARRNRKN